MAKDKFETDALVTGVAIQSSLLDPEIMVEDLNPFVLNPPSEPVEDSDPYEDMDAKFEALDRYMKGRR